MTLSSTLSLSSGRMKWDLLQLKSSRLSKTRLSAMLVTFLQKMRSPKSKFKWKNSYKFSVILPTYICICFRYRLLAEWCPDFFVLFSSDT